MREQNVERMKENSKGKIKDRVTYCV